MLPSCLILDNSLPAKTIAGIEAVTTPIFAKDNPSDDILKNVQYAVVSPMTGFDESWFDRLANLKLIAVFGVGFDKINIKEARRRNIDVTTTLGILTEDVTDMALALLLALTRKIVKGDEFIRAGTWAKGEKFPLGTSIRGKKVGIVGLGAIGLDIAERTQAFGMLPRYYNRSPKANITWPHYPNVVELAKDSDALIVAISANGETEKIINKDVLEALGSSGVLINIARGSVIDEDALITALQNKIIAGAGLDVFLNEPKINPAFLTLDNVVLAPHQGSATNETREAMGQCVIDNIKAIIDGKPALTLIN
ncbi:2-hydroxyacid dehydrogenase [Bartonella sp. HY329]|uniref:2-hydroxyacid dehydrogenase n=1 Tax=unclassified Bartonella TaxID=2645622 RepID=UPI0021C9FE34|nr:MULTISPECIES: 2-hydroxyacid dehydrogenase [unclassified Bartonella]UXM94758.1 2-hydroxyacid dehydrogenase [Bartonella sp. HY329]UXN09081.1 2-hydroxyacid dehydrogenase [Bartonella sp. HY328]